MAKLTPMKEKKGNYHRGEREELSVTLKAAEGRKSSQKKGNTTLPNTVNNNTMSPNARMSRGQNKSMRKEKSLLYI
eukprot:13648454-Ditylum_brightwellii.AAC.1